MKTRLYLDTRHSREGADAPLYLVITHRGEAAWLPLNIAVSPSRWDAAARRLKQLPDSEWPQRRRIKHFIETRVMQVEDIVMQGELDGDLHGLTAAGIRDYVRARLYPQAAPAPVLFMAHLQAFADRHHARTRELYLLTADRIRAFTPDCDTLTFEDITVSWLHAFDAFMSTTSPSRNSRNIHLRNIRAIFNDAIDAELTTCYPFRRFRIRGVETAKRSFTPEQLRAFLSAPCPTAIVEEYREIFRLIFLLIGINVADLFALRPSDYYDGRIHYTRAKTHKAYDIKVEPEAAAIIERRRGKRALLDCADTFTRSMDYMHYLNKNLKRVGEYTDAMGNVCRPFAAVTSYWARHSWATTAINALDVPKETVSAALGHEIGNRITSVYIDFDRRKVDEANRRVIDFVFGEK